MALTEYCGAQNWHVPRSRLDLSLMSENTYHHLPSRFRTSTAAPLTAKRSDRSYVSALYVIVYGQTGATSDFPSALAIRVV